MAGNKSYLDWVIRELLVESGLDAELMLTST